jgi:hypothetical protein
MKKAGVISILLLFGILISSAFVLAEDEINSQRGTVQFTNVEGGCWRISGEDGENYEPIGLNEAYKKDGLKIKFSGKIADGRTSVCQVGTLISITKIEIDEDSNSEDDSSNGDSACPSICIEMYEINESGCVFNECGSGCGPNEITSFKTMEQCQFALSGEKNSESSNSKKDGSETANREKVRIRSRENVRVEFAREVTAENRARVKIEREVETENGKVKIKIKKTVVYANGSKEIIEIEIERNEDGITREIKIGGDILSIDKELEINDLFENNESELKAVLSDGSSARIRVLPERAKEIALERLRARNVTNLTLEEIRHENIPRVVYNIESNENGRFLGVFKLRLRTQAQIDTETGEIISINRPWWAFLVSVLDESNEEESASA